MIINKEDCDKFDLNDNETNHSPLTIPTVIITTSITISSRYATYNIVTIRIFTMVRIYVFIYLFMILFYF
jgi:hypothetical protein